MCLSHIHEHQSQQSLLVGYVAYVENDTVTLSDEHEAFKWLSIEEAKKIDLPKPHAKILSAAIEYCQKNSS